MPPGLCQTAAALSWLPSSGSLIIDQLGGKCEELKEEESAEEREGGRHSSSEGCLTPIV